MCPNAKIMSARPPPKPTATPTVPMVPGYVIAAAIPMNPMKKNPKVPTASTVTRIRSDGLSMGPDVSTRMHGLCFAPCSGS